MKNFRKSILIFGILFIALQANAAPPQPDFKGKTVKIAILNPGKKQGMLVDLLTAKLSVIPGIKLLERTDVDKILKEQKLSLSSNKTKEYLKVGSLLGADGIIALNPLKANENKFITAQLIGIKTGAVFESMYFPLPLKDPEKCANNISHRFSWLFTKLDMDLSKTRRISMLSIRYPTSVDYENKTERQLTQLLNLLFMWEDNICVLDRTNIRETSQERELSGKNTKDLLTATNILEGVIEPDQSRPENIKLTLYLKSPKKEREEITLNGNTKKIVDLAQNAANEVIKKFSKDKNIVAWKTKDEAKEYQKEAEWAYRRKQYELAQESCEAAIALGINSDKIKLLRIQAYGGSVYKGSYFDSVQRPKNYIEPVTHALNLYEQFIKQKAPQLKGKKSGLEAKLRSYSKALCSTSGRVLYGAHTKKLHQQKEYKDQLNELRRASRTVYKISFDNLYLPSFATRVFPTYLQFSAFWHETPDDTIKSYQKLISSDFAGKKPEIQYESRNQLNYRKPYLFGKNKLQGRISFFPPLASWKNQSQTILSKQWKTFIKSLLKSQNDNEKICGMILALKSESFRLQHDELVKTAINMLWEKRNLIKNKEEQYSIYMLLIGTLNNVRVLKSRAEALTGKKVELDDRKNGESPLRIHKEKCLAIVENMLNTSKDINPGLFGLLKFKTNSLQQVPNKKPVSYTFKKDGKLFLISESFTYTSAELKKLIKAVEKQEKIGAPQTAFKKKLTEMLTEAPKSVSIPSSLSVPPPAPTKSKPVPTPPNQRGKIVLKPFNFSTIKELDTNPSSKQKAQVYVIDAEVKGNDLWILGYVEAMNMKIPFRPFLLQHDLEKNSNKIYLIPTKRAGARPYIDMDFSNSFMWVTNDNIYLRAGTGIINFDRKTNKCKTLVKRLNVPSGINKVTLFHNKKLYLGYSGIFEIDAKTGKVNILASYQRKPPKNALDSRPLYKVLGIMKNDQGQILTFTSHRKEKYSQLYTFEKGDTLKPGLKIKRELVGTPNADGIIAWERKKLIYLDHNGKATTLLEKKKKRKKGKSKQKWTATFDRKADASQPFGAYQIYDSGNLWTFKPNPDYNQSSPVPILTYFAKEANSGKESKLEFIDTFKKTYTNTQNIRVLNGGKNKLIFFSPKSPCLWLMNKEKK